VKEIDTAAKHASLMILFNSEPLAGVHSPEALLQANLRWLDRRGIDSWIAPDAQVEMNARLDRSIVGAGSRVSGTGIARRCVVFPGATLEAPADGALVGRRFRCVVPA